MIALRVLTCCVGISAYSATQLESGERPLQFLAAGARELSELFRAMWPDAGSRHLVWIDDQASAANIARRLSAEGGPYDLFVLYLGGHGRLASGSFQFLFHDAAVAVPAIDSLLSSGHSNNVLLLLDACYSGAFLTTTKFFREGSLNDVRICITSSRADQKSWEDEHFRKSLFADALCKAFTTGGSRAKKLGSDIFAVVADDVTRHAFALKRSTAQEPAVLGENVDSIRLPVVIARSTGAASMSTYRVLLRRSWQIACGATATGLLFILTTFAFVWRPAVNSSGLVELRAGPKWLSPLNVGPWARRIETEITVSDLNPAPSTGEIAALISNEEGVHLWPGRNRARMRRWSSVFVDTYLNAEVAARWRVRLGYPDAGGALIQTIAAGGGGGLRAPTLLPRRTTTMPSAGMLAAELNLLDPQQAASEVWEIEWNQHVISGNCRGDPLPQNAIDRIDIYLQPSQTENYVRWLQGLAVRARTDDSLGFEQIVTLIEMFNSANAQWDEQYRAIVTDPEEPITSKRLTARFSERPALAEIRELGNVAAAIAARRAAASIEVVSAAERSRLNETLKTCAEVAAPVLAHLGNDGNPAAIMAWAHGRSRGDQGRTALRVLATHGALPQSEVIWVLETLGFNGAPVDRKRAFVNAREWLTSLSDVMSLSPEILSRLLDYSVERLERSDLDGAREALMVIAHSAQSLDGDLGRRADEVAARAIPQGAGYPTTLIELEWLGLQARGGRQLNIDQAETLAAILDEDEDRGVPRVVFTESDRSAGASVAQLVAGITLSELVAYARFISRPHTGEVKMDARAVRFLEQSLADAFRFGVPARRMQEVASAAARVRLRAQPVTVDETLTRIRALARDAAARRGETEIAKAETLMLSSEARAQFIEGLRLAWQRESEPETKLALAELIIHGVIAVGNESQRAR